MALDWDTLLRQLTGGGDSYRVARGIIQMESGGNPSNTNIKGNTAGKDWGLFMLNDSVGQGIGYSPSQLLDPIKNISVGLPPVLRSIRAGQSQGISGYALFNYVLGDRAAGHTALVNQSEQNKVSAWNTQGASYGPQLPLSGGLPALPGLPGLSFGNAALDRQLGTQYANTGIGPNLPPPLAPGATAADVPKTNRSLLDWFRSPLPDLKAAGYTTAGLLVGVLLLGLGVYLIGASFSGGGSGQT